MSIAPLQKEHTQSSKIVLNESFDPVELQAAESLPVNLKVLGLSIEPRKVSIKSPLDYTQILVNADLGNGKESDVTRMVKWTYSEKIGAIDNRGLFTPYTDGKGKITATLNGHSVSSEISISGLNQAFQPCLLYTSPSPRDS